MQEFLVSGGGTVYSWTAVWRAARPGWANDLHCTVAAVELDEQAGLLMVGDLPNSSPRHIRAGRPAEVTFVDVSEDITLP
jgi:uncharacterized OB-fold protein